MKRFAVPIAIAIAGCSPRYTSGKIECSDQKECPSGYSCSDDGKSSIHYCFDNDALGCSSASVFYCSQSKTCWAKAGPCSTVAYCGTAKNPAYVICAMTGYAPDCNGTMCYVAGSPGTGGSRDAGPATGGAGGNHDASPATGGAGGNQDASPATGGAGGNQDASPTTGGAGGSKDAVPGTGGTGGNNTTLTNLGGSGGAGGNLGTGGNKTTLTSLGGSGGAGGSLGTGGIVGSGGVVRTGGGGGSGAIAGSGGAAGTGGCGNLIDDMEADTGRICSGSGRVGLWFTYVDSSTTSAIAPPTTGPALPELLSTPRGTSKYAMHVKGTYSTYAGIAVWLNKSTFSGSTGTYNASAYTAITFYAKGSGGTLNVVGQMDSTEQTQYGGTCAATTCTGDSYVYPVALPSTYWTQITVPFAFLTGGTQTPFDPSALWSLEFQYYSSTSLNGASFDLWIDDLSFY